MGGEDLGAGAGGFGGNEEAARGVIEETAWEAQAAVVSGVRDLISYFTFTIDIYIMIAIELFSVYDYTDQKGTNVIREWVIKHLTVRDRAKLESKLDALARMDSKLAYGTKLIARVHKNVWKLRVHGETQLRPMLCLGPVDTAAEYTILAGAKEVGGKLEPISVVEQSLDRCQHILDCRGVKHRCRHERYA